MPTRVYVAENTGELHLATASLCGNVLIGCQRQGKPGQVEPGSGWTGRRRPQSAEALLSPPVPHPFFWRRRRRPCRHCIRHRQLNLVSSCFRDGAAIAPSMSETNDVLTHKSTVPFRVYRGSYEAESQRFLSRWYLRS